MTRNTMALTMIAGLAAPLAVASAASQSFNLGTYNVGAIPDGLEVNQSLGSIGFNANRVKVAFDWTAGAGNPWSVEALWAIADGPLATASNFYADPGSSDDALSSGAPVTLTWDVSLIAQGWDGAFSTPGFVPAGQPLTFVSGQTFAGSDADWSNVEVTLSDDGDTAVAPTQFIDLGVVANEFQPFTFDTFGSDFDTELGAYNSQGGIAEVNDDSAGNLQSEIAVPGLPAGDYFINAGGFNTVYDDFYSATVGDFGSDGGDLVLNIDGSEVYSGALAADSNQWFRYTVVPTPGTAGLLAVAGLAAVRRRRA